MFSRKWGPSTGDLVFEALTNASQPSGVLAVWRANERRKEEAGSRVPAWLRQLWCMAFGGCRSADAAMEAAADWTPPPP